jgi:hypothetical protein
MEDIKKIYKLKLCTYYENGKCYKSKEKCNYAHGKDDLRGFKKECKFGSDCFREDCIFKHPEDWVHKNNNFYTNDDSCEIDYIDEKKEENNKCIEDKKLDINNNDEVPSLNEDNVIYSNIVEEEYENNIDNELILDVKIFVDDVEFNNSDNILNINEDIKIKEEYETVEENHDNVLDSLNEMQNIFEDFSKEVKCRIDKKIINDKYIYGVNIKIQLNDIMSRISLLGNNYKDMINILKIDKI